MNNKNKITIRFIRAYLILTITLMAALAILNWAIDPYGAFNHGHLQEINVWRNTGGKRIGKAAMLQRGNWETIILGSSRGQIGFNPEHHNLTKNTTLNSALYSTTLHELCSIADFALQHNSPKTIILIMDFAFFIDLPQRPDYSEQYLQSQFNPDLPKLDFWASMLLGSDTTNKSNKTIRFWLKQEQPKYTTQGFTTKISPIPITLFSHEPALSEGQQSPRELEYFAKAESMIAQFAQRGIRLIMVLPPTHALYSLKSKHYGLDQSWKIWKQQLTALAEKYDTQSDSSVELWDFAIIHPLTTEPIPLPTDSQQALQWHWSIGHFKSQLGDIVIDRIMEHEDKYQFGQRLTSNTLEQWLHDDQLRLQQYTQNNPDDAALINQEVDLSQLQPTHD